MFGSLKMAAFLRLETLRHHGARCDFEKERRDYCGEPGSITGVNYVRKSYSGVSEGKGIFTGNSC